MQGHIVLKPSSNVSLTVSTTAVTFSDPPTAATGGILTVESGDVRCRWDGETPVAGAGGGMPMPKNSVWEISGRDVIAAMQFVRDASDDAVVTASYVKGE